MFSDHSAARLNAFPVFFGVRDRLVAIVGGGDEAFAKARLLSQSSARIVIFAEDPEADLVEWSGRNGVAIERSPWRDEDFADAVLLFAATGEEAPDRAVVEAGRRLRVPVNAVDRPDICDFFTPALVNRAPVAVAIGTEGAGPVLAQIIRAAVDRMLSPGLGRLASLANDLRDTVNDRLPAGSPRRQFWRSFFSGEPARRFEAEGADAARRSAIELLGSGDERVGRVALVGAGPGAEDLLTLRAHRLMMEADVIVHDALVPDAVIALGRRDAERISVGKRKGCHSKSQTEINQLLVELGRAGKRVVRLKCGDPLVFGRAGEEIAALRDAGIAFEIVPGITSALAAAADFELPPTLRGVASSFVLTTGHDLKSEALPDWARLAVAGATVAIYMGRSNAADVASRLASSGLATDTPVAVVENASLASRRLFHGTLADLPGLQDRHDLTGPVMTIIGETVAAANLDRSEPLRSAVPAAIAA